MWLVLGLVALLVLAGAARVQWERADERREERERWDRGATWALSFEILFVLTLLATGWMLYMIEGILVFGIPLDSLIVLALGVAFLIQAHRASGAVTARQAAKGKTLYISGGLLVLTGIGGLVL